jgi:protein TonB
MSAYVHDTSFFSRRAIVFVAIVGLHVLLAWMLASGLAHKIVEVIAPPIETKLIEELEERNQPPPPPPPEFERPPIEVPPPEVSIDIPSESTTAITDVTTRHVEKAPPAPPPLRKVVRARALKLPNSADYYPPASIRLEEQGSVGIKACVGPNGKLSEAPTVVTGSGSARLDEAAVRLAKAGRYAAGSIDGAPTTDCYSFRIKFEFQK